MNDIEEPTLEQVQEYCRKRCLVIVTEEYYQTLLSGLRQETNAYKTRLRQLLVNKEENNGENDNRTGVH